MSRFSAIIISGFSPIINPQDKSQYSWQNKILKRHVVKISLFNYQMLYYPFHLASYPT